MTLGQRETTAILRTLLPWWATLLLIWIIFGVQQHQIQNMQLFANLFFYTGLGGWLILLTGAILIAVGVWFVYDSLTTQIETQVAYQLATSPDTLKEVRGRAFELVNKNLLQGVTLTKAEQQTILDQLKPMDDLVLKAIDTVYRNTAIVIGSMVAVLGIMLILSLRLYSISGTIYFYFSLALALGAAYLANSISAAAVAAVTPNVDVYVGMYNTFKIWEKRLST